MTYLSAIIFYLFALVAVGIFKVSSVKDSEDFMVAGRTLPWYILVGTLLATWMGSGSLFSGAGLGYRNGLAGLWSSAGAWMGIALIYFILPSAALAFFLGCKKHGDKKVAVMGIIGIALLTTSILIHEVFHSEQHSEEMISVLITIAGSVTLIFSHLRNRRLCELVNYECHK